MKDLLKFLFDDSQQQADLEDLASEIPAIFEDIGKIEGLQIKSAPLVKALKELDLEVKDSDVEADCCGLNWTLDSDCGYLKAKEALLRPENMHVLAELGWIALPAGDVKGTTEEAKYKIKFLQIYEPEMGDADKADDFEKMMKAAQELGDAHPADGQEDAEDEQKKLAKERRIGVPAKKEKKDESLEESKGTTYKIERKPESDEWVVVVREDGKRNEERCYYADDKKDAEITLKAMQLRDKRLADRKATTGESETAEEMVTRLLNEGTMSDEDIKAQRGYDGKSWDELTPELQDKITAIADRAQRRLKLDKNPARKKYMDPRFRARNYKPTKEEPSGEY